MKLAENIRSLRRGRKMTQEQLAEAMGVTVGAVSKWEAGTSTPDLRLIVEMAGFFETSVDALLGYEWHRGKIEEVTARIKALRNAKQFDQASAEAEKALQKYPNSFAVVFASALQYSLRGVEQKSKKSLQRALALFERSLELIDQNTNEHISEWSIRNSIADIYVSLGDKEKALERLKQNNVDGLNNGEIGHILSKNGDRSQEALSYLSDALIGHVTELTRVVNGYANAYEHRKDYAAALAVTRWIQGVMAGLERPGIPSYLWKLQVQFAISCAMLESKLGNGAAAREALKEARALALAFDAAPSHNFAGCRFFHGDTSATAFDDFGVTALQGVEDTLKGDEPALLPLWRELNAPSADLGPVEEHPLSR